MIAVICTKCRATLDVDEAFAGSACRCHHCGTIQTVPGKKRAAQPAGASPRTLYSTAPRVANAGTGLDELADVVASSGLHQHTATPRKPAEARPNGVPLAWVVGGGAAVGVVILGLLLLLMKPDPAPAPPRTPGGQTTSLPPQPAQQSSTGQFMTIDLSEPLVIYLIDRGSSARESFAYAQAATIRSVRSLGANRKFQILFWDNGQPDSSYPPGAPIYATAHDVNAAQRSMESVVAFGRSDAIPPLKRAIASRPGAIVMITAKGWELDDTFVKSVEAARLGSDVKIHAISIGGGGSEALERVAKSSGGTFMTVTPGELRDFAEQ